MMSGTKGASDRPSFGTSGAPQAGRALVVVETQSRNETDAGVSARVLATFLAHLIATHHHAPQTRSRRRAGAGDAATAYRAGLAARRAPPRRPPLCSA